MTKVETTASVPKVQLSTLQVNVVPRINYMLRKKPLKALDRLYSQKGKQRNL